VVRRGPAGSTAVTRSSGDEVSYQLGGDRHAWIQMIKGAVNLNSTTLHAGDGAAVSEETSLTIRATEDAEIMLFDLA
jgi:quercetin 2,3-dioxygenase